MNGMWLEMLIFYFSCLYNKVCNQRTHSTRVLNVRENVFNATLICRCENAVDQPYNPILKHLHNLYIYFGT